MSVTVEQLQNYVGTKETGTFIEGCLSSATLLVNNYIKNAAVPTNIKEQAILTAASELFHRRSAPNGVAQFASLDGSPVRIAKDPMNAVYPLLMPFVRPAL
jgi:hypothetical protein